MRRETLLDFFDSFSELPHEFLIHDDGYRQRSFSYRQVAQAARGFAARLRAASIGKGDKVLIWSENRPEWVAALWGCLLEGIVLVPIDYRASADLLRRIHGIVHARALLTGAEVQPPADLDVPVWKFDEFDWNPQTIAERTATITKDDIAEIIFTSGATAEPKGVVITHRNILANIVPIENEVLKYRKYQGPFFPVRFLNLLPLSHMFGQATATFVPPMLPGVVVFLRGYNPQEIVRQVHKRRISVIVSVPRILELLREHIVHLYPETLNAPASGMHWTRRWWKYRRVHSLFGWKFWCFIVGAAPLDSQLEEYWSRLGLLVVQGYGLTETAPIVSLNHPFHARKGTVGKAIGGVEIKLAEDGEILVRGENVTQGYFGGEHVGQAAFDDGWLHTGDIGNLDQSGNLYVHGRKKEMIVLPDGMKVFPEDVERVLNQTPGVEDSAVVGKDHVHAVLKLQQGVNPDEVVRTVNARLEDHQKIRAVSVWPNGDLPRTEGTRKLRRAAIQEWVATGRPPTDTVKTDEITALVQTYAPGRAITPETTLDELGLSSLDRVELMMELEQRLHTNVDETAFTSALRIGDLPKQTETTPAEEPPVPFPRWNLTTWARLLRWAMVNAIILPLTRYYARITVRGRENLRDLQGPVIFAPNHQSHMDVPAILAALPLRWRTLIAPAMSKEYFTAHFHPKGFSLGKRFTNSLQYYLSALFFNAFPIPQRESGTRQTMRYMGDLVSEGWSVLIFPEGDRTNAGEIKRFQPGIGMIASRLAVPVIPVRIVGLDRVLHKTARHATRAPVEVIFGEPLRLQGEDYATLAKNVEAAVRALSNSHEIR
jgi:long-chain acyl-CoA synthetase